MELGLRIAQMFALHCGAQGYTGAYADSAEYNDENSSGCGADAEMGPVAVTSTSLAAWWRANARLNGQNCSFGKMPRHTHK